MKKICKLWKLYYQCSLNIQNLETLTSFKGNINETTICATVMKLNDKKLETS